MPTRKPEPSRRDVQMDNKRTRYTVPYGTARYGTIRHSTAVVSVSDSASASPTVSHTVSQTDSQTVSLKVSPTVSLTVSPAVSPAVSPTVSPTVSPAASVSVWYGSARQCSGRYGTAVRYGTAQLGMVPYGAPRCDGKAGYGKRYGTSIPAQKQNKPKENNQKSQKSTNKPLSASSRDKTDRQTHLREKRLGLIDKTLLRLLLRQLHLLAHLRGGRGSSSRKEATRGKKKRSKTKSQEKTSEKQLSISPR